MQSAIFTSVKGQSLSTVGNVKEGELFSNVGTGSQLYHGANRITANSHTVSHAQPATQRGAENGSELSEPQSRNSIDSDFELAAENDSDYSGDSMQRKRRRDEKTEQEAAWRKKRSAVDTEMRRKLRGNNLEGNGESLMQSSTGGPGSEIETLSQSEEEFDPTAVPNRVVSSKEEEEQKLLLKTSWELVAILDFLATFQLYLNLEHLHFNADELESALVLSNGTGGLLADLHIGLLKGISARSTVNQSTWPASLAEKLKTYWRMGALSGTPPFAAQRRQEAAVYASLPLSNRLTALRILCELRLDKDDLHNVVEHALHPPRKLKTERKAEKKHGCRIGKDLGDPAMPTMAQMRKEPLAKDSSGLMYWYMEHHNTTGPRMYRETPDSLLKAKSKKALTEPQWELVASSVEEFIDLGEKLKRSKKKADQTLSTIVLNDVVQELLELRETEAKKQRAAARMRSQLTNILPDDVGGYAGRSRRARKEINYSYDAFDATIRAALRGSGQHQEPYEGRNMRSQAFLENRCEPRSARPCHETKSSAAACERSLYRMTPEEEAMLGLRRGRSAYAPDIPVELADTHPLKESEVAEGPTAVSLPSTPAPSLIDAALSHDSADVGAPERDSNGQAGSQLDDQQDSGDVEISDIGSKDNFEEISLEAGSAEYSNCSERESKDHLVQNGQTAQQWE